ncbi:MAG: DUF3857 domain-containing protein [Prevotella sp.]|nr:DUF3857 domain-containing protein [Prevotella sp.]
MKIKTLKRSLILLVLAMAFPTVFMGQPSNFKFGSPTDEELTMTSYAPDESAPAVVLYQSTRVWYDILTGKFKVYTEVKTRIKILKSEGKEYADVEVPYIYDEHDKSFREDITGLKAWAYNMENGKMVKTKMENNSVSRERVDKTHMLLKFSIPQVKEGTVVEYQYKKESDYYFYIDTWVAQAEIPVAYTYYNLLIPEYFRFSIDETGMVRTENKVEEESIRFIDSRGNDLVCTGTRYEFVGHDLPALKSDSYVFCTLDYCKKVSAELRGLEVPGSLYENFTTSWEEIGRRLMADDDFGKRIKRACPIKDLVSSSGVEKETDVVKKMAAIYTALKSRLKWNGNYKLYAESASKTLKDGTGSNADLNFILLSAYREAGLDARPVVMSRRTKGRLPLSHPSLNKLNTLVVGVVDGQTVHFIDASVEDGYVDVLPPSLLTEQGLLLSDDGTGNWLNLQSLDASKANVIVEGTLEADGTIKGTCNSQMRANLSASLKSEFREADDSLSYINKLAERDGITISEYAIDDREAFLPMATERFSFTKKVEADGSHIYLNPFVIPMISESPFKAVTRVLPVEYPYKYTVSMVTTLNLPEGYVVEEMPKPLNLVTDDKTLSMRVNYALQGEKMVVQCRFVVNKTLFLPEEYDTLRQIYDSIVEKNNEMVVLKKG